MASPTNVPASTPIAQLDPALESGESSATGIVTLIWPYASSKKTYSLLLVEPDFRLRSHRGQVRVHFQGSSAKAVARSGISSGDQLLLGLRGAQWEKKPMVATTPGRGIDWELHFGERLVLQIQRPSQQPIVLDINYPTPSPEPSVQTSLPVRSPPHIDHFTTPIERPQLKAQVWASPAFLKRSHFLAGDHDPFAEDEFSDNDRRKRTKFGRGSGQWRFTERTPSPEKEPETPRLEIASPSRLPSHGRIREEEARSLVQQAHGTRSSSKASRLATNGLTHRSELEVQPEDKPTIKIPSITEGEERSTSAHQVSGGTYMLHEIKKQDEDVGNSTVATPRNPPTKTNLDESEMATEPEEVENSTARAMSLRTPKIDNADDAASQEPAQVTKSSPSAHIEILSSASSSSASESDQESDDELDQRSDDGSHWESDHLYRDQSESGRSNAAMYSGPASAFGVDGSIFSRPPQIAESPPPSVTSRLEGLEVDSMNTDDAQDTPSTFEGHVQLVGSEIEVASISRDYDTELSLSDDQRSEEGIDMLDAAQRRASVQLPSSDPLESSEAGERDDEAMRDPAAPHLLGDARGSSEDVHSPQDDVAVQRSSSNLPPSIDQFESQEAQEKIKLRPQEMPDNEAVLDLKPEKSPADSPQVLSPPSSQEQEYLSDASDKQHTLETSPEKALAELAVVRQESPVQCQQEMEQYVKLSQQDSKTTPSQGREIRDHAESAGKLTSNIQQTTVEIIDLESGDEDDISPHILVQEGFKALVDKIDSNFAPTDEKSAPGTPLPLVSDARNEHQRSMPKADRLSSPPDSTGLVLKSVVHTEPDAPRETLLPGEEGFRKQSPVARIEGDPEEPPSIEKALFQRSHEARLGGQERELPSDTGTRPKQSATRENKLQPIPVDELPSTVPDSFADTTSKSQLLTPSATQRPSFVSQPSFVSLSSAPEDNALPTPQLTQGTSAEAVPPQPFAPPHESSLIRKPAPPKKTSALIEKLKEMRRLANQNPKTRSSDASVLDPWFAPKRLSQVVPDSEAESEAESSPERETQGEFPNVLSGQLPQTPEKPLAKSFIRSPRMKDISSIQSSPQYLPPSLPPPPGFRTNLSYFVPLATLPSHFGTTADVLAIALSSTPVTRATSGPRDYSQTLYITDPSSSVQQNFVTTAQIFRPKNRCFPLVEKGDALLLRDFKVQPFQKRLSLLSTESSAWAVFRKGAGVQIRGPPLEFEAEERAFARGLWQWWASIGDNARMRLEDAVPEYKRPDGTAKETKTKAGEKKSDAPIKIEEIEGLGVDLPGSQTKRRESTKERPLGLDGVENRDMVHESIEAPKRVLRARGAKGANGRSESARESRFGTVFVGGLGEPDETQGSAHELRDGKAYRDKRE